MRNFMGYDRRWLDEPHVGDHVGRTIWALGEILATAWIPAFSGPARTLLDALVPSLRVDVSLRTAAYTILGLARLDPDRLDRDARVLLERLVEQLASAYHGSAAGSWLWFEDRLTTTTRGSPRRSSSGARHFDGPQRTIGLESLAWLGDECGLDDGMLRLPGHHGRDRDEPAPGRGTSSLSMRPRSSRPSSLRLSRRATENTEFVRATRSTGSWAAIGSTARSTTSRREAAATALADRHQRKRGRRIHACLPSRPAATRCRCTPGPRPKQDPGQSGVTSNREVFRRHAGNPVLTAADWSRPVNAVFNPAAALVDGETVVLARVEDRRGISHLGVARSADGLSGWSIDPEPLLAPADGIESEQWGFEDPRAGLGRRARALADHVHGLRPERPGRLSRVDDGFSDGRADGNHLPTGGQERGASVRAGRRPVGSLSPADDVVRRLTRELSSPGRTT